MSLLRRLAAALARLLERFLSDRPEVLALPPAPIETPLTDAAGTVIGTGWTPAPAGPPYFVCDFSHWDGKVDAKAYATDRRYLGAWVKLTQGTREYPYERYGLDLIAALIAAAKAADRLGEDFFVGGYHYLSFDRPGDLQADYLYQQSSRAGLLALPKGCRLRPLMDVERGSSTSANYDDGRGEVTKCALDFADRWYALTGVRPIAYGRGTWRDLGLKGLLHCEGLVNPAYTRDMPPMEAYGVPRSSVVAQQYTDGEANKTTFPTLPPGAKAADTSVLLGPARGELADLDTARRLLTW